MRAILANVGNVTLTDFLPPGTQLGDGILRVAEILEENGWYPRQRRGATGVAYWPDNGRGKQIMLSFGAPLAKQRLEFFAEHTGIEEFNHLVKEGAGE